MKTTSIAALTCLAGWAGLAHATPYPDPNIPDQPPPQPGDTTKDADDANRNINTPTPPPPSTNPAPMPVSETPAEAATMPAPQPQPPPVVVIDEGNSVSWASTHDDYNLSTGFGVGLTVGGGIGGFTDRAMRDSVTSNVGGLWDVRAALGTHSPIGLDVSYVGTAANVQTLTGAPNGTLVGTTVEGAVRLNALPHSAFTPYGFIGIGWQRYDVTSVRFAQSDTGMKSEDDIAVFPMGAGLSYRDRSGLLLDLRGTFRAATDSTLLEVNRPANASGDFASMHTWEASAALGYEF